METNINRVLSNDKQIRTRKNTQRRRIIYVSSWNQPADPLSLYHPRWQNLAVASYRAQTYVRFACFNVLLKKYELGDSRHRAVRTPHTVDLFAFFRFFCFCIFIFRFGFSNLCTDDKAYRLDYTCSAKQKAFFFISFHFSFIHSISPILVFIQGSLPSSTFFLMRPVSLELFDEQKLENLVSLRFHKVEIFCFYFQVFKVYLLGNIWVVPNKYHG